MENSKHLGGMWGLAVALGVGVAIASAPAVASAAPGDSDTGSSDAPSSSSSEKSGSPSAKAPDRPSAKSEPTNESPTKNDAPRRQRHAKNAPAEAVVRSSGGALTSTKTRPSAAKTDDPVTSTSPKESATTVPDVSLDITPTAEPTPVAKPTPVAESTPESTVVTPPPADPGSRIASTLVDVDPPRRDNDAPAASAPVNPLTDPVTKALVTENATPAVEPDFVSSTMGFFGLFSITSAGDPSDDNYVAVVFETPIFTIVLTSGMDPEDNLGFGAPSIGVDGQTVLTFITPFGPFSAGIPVEDPFAELFIELIRAGVI